MTQNHPTTPLFLSEYSIFEIKVVKKKYFINKLKSFYLRNYQYFSLIFLFENIFAKWIVFFRTFAPQFIVNQVV